MLRHCTLLLSYICTDILKGKLKELKKTWRIKEHFRVLNAENRITTVFVAVSKSKNKMEPRVVDD